MRVAAEDHVNAGHSGSELEIHVHAVVRQQDHDTCLAAHIIHGLLHLLFADPEAPVGDEVARVRDRRVRECLADDCDRNPVDLAQRVGRKHGVAEIRRANVLRDEFRGAVELALDRCLHAFRAVGEFPVAGHHVDAEESGRLDHVGAPAP